MRFGKAREGFILRVEAEEGHEDYRPGPILVRIYREECHMFSETQYTMGYSTSASLLAKADKKVAKCKKTEFIRFYFCLRSGQHGAIVSF